VAVGKASEEASINCFTHMLIGKLQVAKEGVMAKDRATQSAAGTTTKAKKKASHKGVAKVTDLTSGSHETWICPRSSATTAMRWVIMQRIVQSLTSGR
jgi:hypothetical protein